MIILFYSELTPLLYNQAIQCVVKPVKLHTAMMTEIPLDNSDFSHFIAYIASNDSYHLMPSSKYYCDPYQNN
jgi:hypothetical protein